AVGLGDAADVGRSVVLHLRPQVVLDVTAGGGDGVRGADGGVGRHGGDVRGHGDEGAGGGGAGAGRCDVHDDGYGGLVHALDDLAHGGVEAAGGVQPDHGCAGGGLLGVVQPSIDVV